MNLFEVLETADVRSSKTPAPSTDTHWSIGGSSEN